MYIVTPDKGIDTSISENDPAAAQTALTTLAAKFNTSNASLTLAQTHITNLKKVAGVDPQGSGRSVPKPG